jgi:alkylated DNA repair dioxygenase AlkB
LNPGQTELFAEATLLPRGFLYQPEFIRVEEERALLEEIARLPLEQARYREYSARRRVASFPDAAPLPDFLVPLRERMARWMNVEPAALAHALVAEYRVGTPLGWHRDAPDFEQLGGVSLGGWATMRLRPYASQKQKPITLDLAPRSAYQMRGPARWRWQHSIPATRELRYSITFRTLVRKD